MTLTATYNNDISRVHLVVSGAPTAADYAYFQRSTDGITWVDVRGGQTVGLTAGACFIDDYVFSPNVVNTYRVKYVDTALPAFTTVGTASTGNNASLSPAAPSGLIDGDLKLIIASIRNNGTGVCGAAPAGWTTVYQFQNMAVYGKRHVTGDANPTVTFTGGVAGADTIAQMARFTNSELAYNAASNISNSSAQNVNCPAITLPSPQGMLLYIGWKQATLTSTTTPSFATKIADIPSAAGTGASMFWDYFSSPLGNGGVLFPGQSVTVTGGSAAISIGLSLTFVSAAYVTLETTTITPAMTDIWLKNVLRPNLNMIIPTEGDTDITEPSRSNAFAVIGRNLPVAVTDVRGSQQFNMYLGVLDNTTRDNIRNALATGDVMYIHIPNDTAYPIKSMYVLVGNTDWRDRLRQYTLPLTQVAAPDGTIIGDTVLWLDVIATYATWSDLIAAKATWSDVVSMIAPGGQVIVG